MSNRNPKPQTNAEPLPIALRVFAETTDDEPEQLSDKKRQGSRTRQDRYVLVLDTETGIDRAQRLTFGVYRYYRLLRVDGQLVCVEEGIFHADELPDRDPDAYELLCNYAKYKEPAIDWEASSELTKDASTQIRLLSEGEMRQVFYEAAYQARAMVVCFNLPFDLSRLAVGWSEARGGKTSAQQRASSFQGGFTLSLFEHDGKPNQFRAGVQIKTIDSKRALKRFTTPTDIDDRDLNPDGSPFRGHLLDLRTLAFALTDRGYSLESACDAFDVPYKKRDVEHGRIDMNYIDYCREDVEATAKLFEALRREYRRHPIKLQMTKAFSPAAIGKSYLDAMNIRPRLTCEPNFPRETLGHAMSAYYGGRAECRIRRAPVPVVYVDFMSMYPTVNSLMGLWKHVTAKRIAVIEGTEEISQLVEQITVTSCLNPNIWTQFPALVQIKPDGDVLPVRARYGDGPSWGIGSNLLYSDDPMWFALPDVIASKLITGKAPKILRAVKFVPEGVQRGLKPIKLRGNVEIDPRKDDLFKAAIEQRRQQKDKNGPTGRFLKTFANGTSYGIYAETIRHELPAKQTQQVTVYGDRDEPYITDISAPEHPGAFAFPPMAACITAAARLMLATLETLVTQAGGTWAFCDTDSMAIVATQTGGLIPCPGGSETNEHGNACVRALSFEQVNQIVRQFEALNPYNLELVPGSVLEIEDENYGPNGQPRQLYCYSISAKRYALYNTDPSGQQITRRIRDAQPDADDSTGDESREPLKRSEHGLGHLLNPTDPDSDSRNWISQIWKYIIETNALDSTTAVEPSWLNRPALTRITITSPRLLKPFAEHDRERPVTERVRPYNFGLVAHLANPGLQGVPDRFLLVAPYETDPRKWRRMQWVNAYEPDSRHTIVPDNGRGHQLSTSTDGRVIIKTYRTVLNDYRTHPEAKSLAPDGQACDRATVGLLARRPVKVATVHHIGKESNNIEDAQSGLVTDLNDVLNEYRNPDQDPLWTLVVSLLSRLPVASTAAAAGVSERTLKRARASQQLYKTARSKLTKYAIQHSCYQLRAAGVCCPSDPEALLTSFLDYQLEEIATVVTMPDN